MILCARLCGGGRGKRGCGYTTRGKQSTLCSSILTSWTVPSSNVHLTTSVSSLTPLDDSADLILECHWLKAVGRGTIISGGMYSDAQGSELTLQLDQVPDVRERLIAREGGRAVSDAACTPPLARTPDSPP